MAKSPAERIAVWVGRLERAQAEVDRMRQGRDEAIREAYQERYSMRDVAAMAGVAPNAIFKIIHAGDEKTPGKPEENVHPS